MAYRMICADTDVLIDALGAREPGTGRVADGIRSGRMATTAVTVFELLAGAREQTQRERISRLLGGIQIWPLDEAAASRAAGISRDLAPAGNALDRADCLIAGICLARGGRLLTRNRRHFERIKDLELADFE